MSGVAPPEASADIAVRLPNDRPGYSKPYLRMRM